MFHSCFPCFPLLSTRAGVSKAFAQQLLLLVLLYPNVPGHSLGPTLSPFQLKILLPKSPWLWLAGRIGLVMFFWINCFGNGNSDVILEILCWREDCMPISTKKSGVKPHEVSLAAFSTMGSHKQIQKCPEQQGLRKNQSTNYPNLFIYEPLSKDGNMPSLTQKLNYKPQEDAMHNSWFAPTHLPKTWTVAEHWR